MPSVPSATTVNPMTAPLEKATRRAAAKAVVAAWVVRTAAPVAVRIPTQPAVAERPAPARKLTPMRHLGLGKLVACALALACTAGCGTIAGTLGNAGVYAGVRHDIRLMREEVGWRPRSLVYWPALDVPLSAVADTFLLPVTVTFRWCARRREARSGPQGVV